MNYDLLINHLKQNFDLASLQLVLHGHKQAASFVIKIKEYPAIKFKKVPQDNFLWYFKKLEEKDLVQVYIVDTINIEFKNIQVIQLLKSEFDISISSDVLSFFERTIRSTPSPSRTDKTRIKQNLLCGLYYNYPLKEVLAFIHENYIEKKRVQARQEIFFFTKYDYCGYISYFNNTEDLIKLKQIYLDICNQHNYECTFYNSMDDIKIPIIKL